MQEGKVYIYLQCSTYSIVTEKTGISPTMLRQEPPLSVVFPDFMSWIVSTTVEVSEACNAEHYPG